MTFSAVWYEKDWCNLLGHCTPGDFGVRLTDSIDPYVARRLAQQMNKEQIETLEEAMLFIPPQLRRQDWVFAS